MNFLHIGLSESWGGLEMAVLKWNQILKEKGHSNQNICTPNSPLAQHLKEEGFPVIEWDSAHYFAPDFTGKLHRFIRENYFQAIILQNLRDLWIVSPALYKERSVKLIGFAQMLLAIRKTDFLHRLVYQRLDHLLTLTDWQQQALGPYLPVPPKKYSTIPNFVDCQKFHPKNRSDEFRYHLGFQREDFVIGVIGRIDEQKGQLELLRAFTQIALQFSQAHLVIIGEPTRGEPKQEKYFQSLKKEALKNQLDAKIHFIGFQKDTEKYFANFDLFVLPSHEETFGYVVVEAMASGTPVLATQAGGVPEILKNGKLGYLVQPKNVKNLSEKLVHVLNQGKERQQKAADALEWVRHFYDRNQVCARFLKIIRGPSLR